MHTLGYRPSEQLIIPLLHEKNICHYLKKKIVPTRQKSDSIRIRYRDVWQCSAYRVIDRVVIAITNRCGVQSPSIHLYDTQRPVHPLVAEPGPCTVLLKQITPPAPHSHPPRAGFRNNVTPTAHKPPPQKPASIPTYFIFYIHIDLLLHNQPHQPPVHSPQHASLRAPFPEMMQTKPAPGSNLSALHPSFLFSQLDFFQALAACTFRCVGGGLYV